MYKFKSYMMAMLAVGSMAFLSSCGDDEEAKPAPTLVLTGDDANVTTKTAGEDYDIVITSTSNGGSNIMKFEVLYAQNGGQPNVLSAYTEDDIDEPNFVTSFNAPAASTGTESFTFRVTNKDGQATSKTVTYTIAGNAPVSYTAKIMGAVQNSAGSFFSTQNGEVYTTSTAPTNSNKVDFVYFNQNSGGLDTLGATITSPSNSNAQVVYPTVASWGTKNTTEFKMGTAANYTDATNANLATAFTGAGSTMTMAHHLAVNNVVLFKTEAGKYGAFKVTAVNTSPSAAQGSITIDVKVQP